MRYLSLILTVLLSFNTYADYETYDDIVDKLSRATAGEIKTKAVAKPTFRTLSTAHIGLGFTQTFYDADAAGLDSRIQNQGGIIVTVGVDLMRRWSVEGAYINFGKSQADSTDIRLKEFVIRGVYTPELNKNWNMRLGMGVSSRFLDIANTQASNEYRTPSGLFLFGVESYINSFVSIGADLSFKTSMISDTIDKNSVDLAFKLDTHF